MAKKFSASDLPIIDGKIYHLNIQPKDISRDIIIVGDPERVSMIAEEFLKEIEIEVFHRGLRTITGLTKENGHRITITTSGMGTPSLEIVLNELVILNEIDFKKRIRKKNYEPLHIIRVGTSGGIQAKTKLGTPIITEYSLGFDNTGLFYDAEADDEYTITLEDNARLALLKVYGENSRFKESIHPYGARADPEIVESMAVCAKDNDIDYVKGITVSNSGFFANQGRDISRINLTIPDIDIVLSKMKSGIPGLKVENLEMETSFLLHFMSSLDYKAGSICVAIANRELDTFAEDYQKAIQNATKIAIDTLHMVRLS